MQSCLGFYVDKNMIKYAKITLEEKSGQFMTEECGVKFYDNIMDSINDIIGGINMDSTKTALSMANEGYHSIDVFSGLKQKDRNALIESEFATFCEEKGLAAPAMEYRYKLVENTGNLDNFVAICAYTSKSELANITNSFEGLKISSIAPIGFSVNNLFRNKGIDEEAAIVTIENKTTVTILLRNDIQEVVEIPLGMEDVLDKLAEKYNSYAKAYEACKKVSVYIEDVATLDEESRDILDVVLPIFYDIRQRVDEVITPYKRLIKAVYLSGSAVIVNNTDLYFQESFPSLRCEIVKPFFLSQQDRNRQNEIIEANSAIAIALNGLGLLEPSVNFSTAAKKAMKGDSPIKEKLDSLNIKGKIDNIKSKFKDASDGIKSKMFSQRRVRQASGNTNVFERFFSKIKDLFKFNKKGKKNVSYGGSYGASGYGADNSDDDSASKPLNGWVIGLLIGSLMIFVAYYAAAVFVSNSLRSKITQANSSIAKIEQEITKANGDAEYVRARTSEYADKIDKLQRVMDRIATEKLKSTFDIPNFMSQVMFIVPQGVVITDVNISEMGDVTMTAVSNRYAQLGYFVSRLKIENVLDKVDMQVQSMDSNIIIKIGGKLP